MKTLVVEDDVHVRTLLEIFLADRGLDVVSCANAYDALDAFKADSYPLVLLDWMMDGMDGLELCRQMRKLPQGEGAVILVITSRREPGDLATVLAAGADDYISKPLDPGLLDVRLTVARQNVKLVQARLAAQASLAEAMSRLELSHRETLTILNSLKIGSVVTDEHGKVTFASELARRLLGIETPEPAHEHWSRLFPFPPSEIARIRNMMARAQAARETLSLQAPGLRGTRYHVDLEISDYPDSPLRSIFVFYDVTEIRDLRRQLTQRSRYHQLVGRSEPMLQLFEQMEDVAGVDSTVLIEGETGTGKELVARALHEVSGRRHKPFIAVNCAGLTDSLLTSQLFGHKRGAFTGATQDHVGLFEAANGGTLFLDEIGDIPMSVQTALLRVLQEREITRVGDSHPRKIDVRVITATHRDLSEEITKGTFRPDLYYRIRVIRLVLPALRRRREDIPVLVAHFLQHFRTTLNRQVLEVSDEAMRYLSSYDWPGNVRELRSAMEVAAIRCKGPVIEPDDLPPELFSQGVDRLKDGLEHDSAERIRSALVQTRGNRAAAARLLGVSRATFYRHLTRLGIAEADDS